VIERHPAEHLIEQSRIAAGDSDGEENEHWLDQASAQALGVAALRLAADPVGLVFAKPVALPYALCRRRTSGHWRQTANRHTRPVMLYAVATPGDTAKTGRRSVLANGVTDDGLPAPVARGRRYHDLGPREM
jgi:hypothetical protein